MRDYPQFEDLGLWPEGDRTEDLRKSAPDAQVLAHLAGTDHTHESATESR